MAVTDIPRYVDVAPGDLIRAEDWNSIQQQARNSIRTHRHTGQSADSAGDEDNAPQLAADEIADGAVTGSKLADNTVTGAKLADDSVTGAKLANGAVTGAKLAAASVAGDKLVDSSVTAAKLANGSVAESAIVNGAVTNAKIAANAVDANQLQNGAVSNTKLQAGAVAAANIIDGSITRPKLAFQTVNSGSATLGPGNTVEQVVEANATTTKTKLYFPTMVLNNTIGSGVASVTAIIVYRQAVNASTIDVRIRLTNSGTATTSVVWIVTTFAD
jgi:hypothetical protein